VRGASTARGRCPAPVGGKAPPRSAMLPPLHREGLAMLETNRSTIRPPPLGAEEMARVLAAVVAHGDEVAALVALAAPRTAAPLLAELAALGSGRLGDEEPSPALRWILSDIDEELGHRFRAAAA
jgi:hypothetical protein